MPERAYCQFSSYKEGSYPPLAELNILNLQGRLTPEQAAFMAPSKPEMELFDLRDDPHETRNVAEDPKYADVKAELLSELESWRTDVIRDLGVSDEFRGFDVFPETCPLSTVGEWVQKHADEYDFNKHGVPGWYPTRTLEEWQTVKAAWEPWVFREPTKKMKRPVISYTKKPAPSKAK